MRSAPRASASRARSAPRRRWSTPWSTRCRTWASATSTCRARPSACGARSTRRAEARGPDVRRQHLSLRFRTSRVTPLALAAAEGPDAAAPRLAILLNGFFDCLFPHGVDDILGLVEELADLLALGLGLHLGALEAADGESGVVHLPLVRLTVVGASPGCLWSQIELALPHRLSARIGPS